MNRPQNTRSNANISCDNLKINYQVQAPKNRLLGNVLTYFVLVRNEPFISFKLDNHSEYFFFLIFHTGFQINLLIYLNRCIFCVNSQVLCLFDWFYKSIPYTWFTIDWYYNKLVSTTVIHICISRKRPLGNK